MKTILVADDEPGFRELLTTILEMRGYRCLAVSDGDAALEVVAREPVVLFLCDLVLGDLPGTETMVRAREMRPEMQIVAISGAARFDRQADSSLPVGADEMLTKPFQLEALYAIVERLLAE